MKVYRLSKMKYASSLSGKGAALFGNRWNSKGTEIIYTAESRALAMAEVMVHLTLATLPSDFMMIEIEIPDEIEVAILNNKDLPSEWNNHPPRVETQKIGDDFINHMKHCILKVPSAVVKGDHNYLLNPYHLHFDKISIVDISAFPIDNRMFVLP